jgi:hypothetical protein
MTPKQIERLYEIGSLIADETDAKQVKLLAAELRELMVLESQMREVGRTEADVTIVGRVSWLSVKWRSDVLR